ncbi:MAG TPA: DUF3857 domain-containing protein, partial [Pyrinomonadaceae bacterium]|nr:DUF3857 domain-containing protein [Pyrinomonadaceae bacterium]
MNSRSTILVAKAIILFACITFVFDNVAFSQDKDWRLIGPDVLKAEKPVVDADADAEALLWEVRIDDSSADGFTMKNYVRVKIFTERGRERYSKFDIPFFRGLKIKDLAARVIKPDGTIVEIGKNDIFEREIVRASGIKVKAKSFAVPNIEPGVIVEYRYKESYADGGASGLKLEFQKDIPVRDLSYYYKPFLGEPRYKVFNTNDVKFIKDKGGYYLASRTNVPAFKQEPFMPPDDMVRPWVRLGSARISISGMVAKMQLATFLSGQAKGLKKIAAEILGSAATEEEKLAKIYEYCQGQISNTSFDTTLTDEMREKLPEVNDLKDVIKRKSGSAMHIDMLFAALAMAAGMDARIAYLGDRSKMFTSSGNIDQEFLHPGAIGVKVAGKWKFYNPGSKFVPIGRLVWYEEDGAAEVIGEKQFEWSTTPYSDHTFTNTARTAKLVLTEDGTLEGDITVELNGQLAISYRNNNYDESPAKLEENLKDDIKRKASNAEVSAISIENLLDITKPVVHRYHIKIPNYAQKTGKRMFFQPGFFEYGTQPAFTSAQRQYDIFFRHPWSEKDRIEIKFPSNYMIDNGETPAPIFDRSRIVVDEISIRLDAARSTIFYDRDFYFGGQGK